MYQIYLNNKSVLIYDPRLPNYEIFDAKLELELNKTGSLKFTIRPSHPNFAQLKRMKPAIEVYDDNDLIFRGRVLDEEQGFYNEKQVTCEGELAFFLDSVIRPYGSEEKPWKGTPEEYLKKLVAEHNEQMGDDDWKKFTVGNVTVTDGDTSNNKNEIQRSDSDYHATWDLLSGKLVDLLGGYLWVRHEDGKAYLDYLTEEDIPSIQAQPVRFGKNLLDLKKSVKGEDVMTGIIPLGAQNEETNVRVTIASVNDGLDYLVDEDAARELGHIIKPVVWDDVTTPAKLKEKAEAYLARAVFVSTAVELTAADLAGISNANPFRLGQRIEVIDDHHGLDELVAPDAEMIFLVKKLSLDLLNPANNTLNIGATFSTFTESTPSAEVIIEAAKQEINTNISNTYATKEEVKGKFIQQITILDVQ